MVIKSDRNVIYCERYITKTIELTSKFTANAKNLYLYFFIHKMYSLGLNRLYAIIL